jgi:hypothetical protein
MNTSPADKTGLKKITLKVRVAESPSLWKSPASDRNDNPLQVIGPTGLPNPTIMRHLLDVFFIHFGCQFPFLDQTELEAQVDSGAGSAFLFNAIAGIAARSVYYRRNEGGELIPRFSSHPSIALPGLQPHAYGNVFNDRAKVLLGSMLGVPSRETIIAFVLMSYISFANGTSRLYQKG